MSIASLYRYFTDLDELRRDSAARLVERYPELFIISKIGTGERRARIASFTAARLALHETLHPLELLARATSRQDPSARQHLDTVRSAMADQIRRRAADTHPDAPRGHRRIDRRTDLGGVMGTVPPKSRPHPSADTQGLDRGPRPDPARPLNVQREAKRFLQAPSRRTPFTGPPAQARVDPAPSSSRSHRAFAGLEPATSSMYGAPQIATREGRSRHGECRWPQPQRMAS